MRAPLNPSPYQTTPARRKGPPAKPAERPSVVTGRRSVHTTRFQCTRRPICTERDAPLRPPLQDEALQGLRRLRARLGQGARLLSVLLARAEQATARRVPRGDG